MAAQESNTASVLKLLSYYKTELAASCEAILGSKMVKHTVTYLIFTSTLQQEHTLLSST